MIDCKQRQKVILESCHLFGLSLAAEYEGLPERLQIMYSFLSYNEIIRPLVKYQRFRLNKSFRQIGIKYSLPCSSVFDICQREGWACEV